jgi:hypothetical protein
VTTLTFSFAVASSVFTLIVVSVTVGPASGDFVVDGDEVTMLTTDLDNSFRRDTVVVREEPHVNEIHDIIIREDDRVPVFTRLLVVAVCPAIGRSRSHGYRHIVDVGLNAVAHRDVPPRHPSQPKIDDPRRCHASPLRDKEHNRELLITDPAFSDDDHFTLGHVVVVRHRDVEVSNASSDADGCLGLSSIRDEQGAKHE